MGLLPPKSAPKWASFPLHGPLNSLDMFNIDPRGSPRFLDRSEMGLIGLPRFLDRSEMGLLPLDRPEMGLLPLDKPEMGPTSPYAGSQNGPRSPWIDPECDPNPIIQAQKGAQ